MNSPISDSHSPDPRTALRHLLRQTMRVRSTDGRVFLGTFVGTDRELNVLLASAQEFRVAPQADAAADEGEGRAAGERSAAAAFRGPLRPEEGRFVGQVMIPWRLVKMVEVENGMSVGNGFGNGTFREDDGYYM